MFERLVFLIRLPVLLAALAVVLAGCFGEPDSGPVEIKYGRDTCDFCKMIISDPRFAAQIRGGERHKAYKFDDIGDAVHFLKTQLWQDDPKVEFWVMNSDDAKTWLDARKAYFLPGQASPMAYGFAAVAQQRDGTMSFSDMVDKVMVGGASSKCEPEGGIPATPVQPRG